MDLNLHTKRGNFMFKKQDLNVGDWIVFWILMVIPVVNVIIFIITLFSADTNRTLKNMLWGEVILFAVSITLFLTVLAPFIMALWEEIQGYLPY